MKLFIRERGHNSHYFYVMGWKNADKSNAPIKKEKFDIYEDAVDYFKSIQKICGFVQMFEYIGGKRKWLADTKDMSVFENF